MPRERCFVYIYFSTSLTIHGIGNKRAARLMMPFTNIDTAHFIIKDIRFTVRSSLYAESCLA